MAQNDKRFYKKLNAWNNYLFWENVPFIIFSVTIETQTRDANLPSFNLEKGVRSQC